MHSDLVAGGAQSCPMVFQGFDETAQVASPQFAPRGHSFSLMQGQNQLPSGIVSQQYASVGGNFSDVAHDDPHSTLQQQSASWQSGQQPPTHAAQGHLEAGPLCACGLACSLAVVRKDGPNKDRQFFACSNRTCRFFQWADEDPSSIVRGPPCLCDLQSTLSVSRKEGPNMGRSFFSCMHRECGFFQWADEDPQPVIRGHPCTCGMASVQSKVRKDGPNKDRNFFHCAKKVCTFFQWGDEQQLSSQEVGPPCVLCGAQTSKRVVFKDGPTKGKTYMCCTMRECVYFQWAEEISKPMLTGPPCSVCGAVSLQKVTQKEGPTKGRPYFTCSKRSCSFFQWADEPAQNRNGAPCACGIPSVGNVVRKEGPNKGREFFSCARRSCGFWTWADTAVQRDADHMTMLVQSQRRNNVLGVATPMHAQFPHCYDPCSSQMAGIAHNGMQRATSSWSVQQQQQAMAAPHDFSYGDMGASGGGWSAVRGCPPNTRPQPYQ
eukprot:TRINITY_DN13461_c0_g2_i1.p1 TRINITY_DN13461_c0_g2~~TRINITY_DN13461_c0_g2_i1.p1  ORF type:complete len:490 (-),score=36.08 TRINITY_DN13461_c0_g2_i1:269-1738(-)